MRVWQTIMVLTGLVVFGEACTRKKKDIEFEGRRAGSADSRSGTPVGGEVPSQTSGPGTSTGTVNGNNGEKSPSLGKNENEPTPDLSYVTPDSAGPLNAERDANAGTKSGRPSYGPIPANYSPALIQQFVTAHQSRNQGFKYAFLAPQHANDKEMANVLRVALGKAWNHLSWLPEVDLPQDISDGAGLVFALNAPKIWGTRAEENWGYIANCSPKAGVSISPADVTGCDRFDASLPVEISRFVFNAVNGGPYASVHQTPADYGEFQSRYQMGPIIATSTHKEAIVCGPRITAYRYLQINGVQLLYSFSSDEFDGRDGGNINYTNAPTENDERGTGAFSSNPGGGSVSIATEWWIQLPNGFQYWGIHGEGSQERGRAEFPFAIDPANWNQGWELQTGRSCITCHVAGVQSAVSDPEFAGRNGWTDSNTLNQLYAQVRGKFQAAMQKLVNGLSDADDALNQRLIIGTIEPIARAIREIEGPYPGGNNCEFFCNGKYGQSRQNLCEKLPLR